MGIYKKLSDERNAEEYQQPSYNVNESKQKERDNVHRLHQNLIENPLPRGMCQEWIGGHVLDLGMLSEFITYKTSPSFITNVINNVTAKVREDTLDMKKKKPFKVNSGMIILVIIAVACLVLGLIVMMYLPQIMSFFQGIF
jgi:hypothetical protein